MDFAFLLKYMPFLLEGMVLTLKISVLAIVFGLILGFAVALGKLSEFRPFRWLSSIYISFMRGTPLLVQLFLIYFGLPQMGLNINAFFSGVLGLALNIGAYNAEVIRAGILSVDGGQMEAARSLGMSKRLAMRRIILPQAIRIIIPPLGNNFIALIKDSALVSTITVVELTLTAQRLIGSTYKPFDLYFGAAILYWALTMVIALLVTRTEVWMHSKGGEQA